MDIPLIDDSDSFKSGLECGLIWAGMKSNSEFIDHPVRIENEEQLELMAQYFDYVIFFDDMDDEWLSMTARPSISVLKRLLEEALMREDYATAAELRTDISKARL